MKKSEGIVLVLSAPSGTGKTTLCHRLMEKLPDLKFAVSHTTRSPRKGEINEIDYFFISEKEFEQKIENGDFLEWAKVHNHYYGTDSGYLKNVMGRGEDIILDLDVQGVEALREKHFPAKFIFILPPSLTELAARLKNRRTESEEKITQRIDTGKKEIKSYHLYDYVLTNYVVEDTVENIIAILKAEKCSMFRFIPASQEILALLNPED